MDVGVTIGDFRLEERIGRGGMGVVFRATQLSLGRPVALKLIAAEFAQDPSFRERFKREARLAAGIDHPNVVPVHQADEDEGRLYIAMRYVHGTDLHALLLAHGRLDPPDAVRIVEQIAAALDAAHEQGLVHRDVKPANVLLSGADGRGHVYLTDFGLTKHTSSTAALTRTGAFVGTLDYVAPEQVQGGTVDGRADVYALGCVLYELLTATVPFQRESDVAKLYAHMSEPPPRPSDAVPELLAFDAVIGRAMQKDPAARYTTAGELAVAARAAIAGEPPKTARTRVSPARVAAPASPQAHVERLRFNVPLSLANFVGRQAELDALHEVFAVADPVVIAQAITGLGGVGKSQLATRYVHDHGASYDVVAWIRAADGGIADLSELAAELGEHVDDLSPGKRAERALHWLNNTDMRWLLVLDNISSPEQLRSCCPHSGHGRVLVTSRHQGLRQFGPPLPVDVFDEDTATSFLVSEAGRPRDDAGARPLARALGCLPLALSHAGAYCATGTSFDEYLALLTELPASSLFDASSEAFYEETVASTWQVSINAAAADAPLAATVLTMAAHLGPDAIPKRLFGTLIDPGAAAERKGLSDAFNALHRFSLMKVGDDTVSMHRVVQKTVRDDAASRGDARAALQALGAVDEAFPQLESTSLPASWPACEQLLPHVLALADTLTAPGDSATRLIELLIRCCHYLAYAGDWMRGPAVAETAASRAAELLGEEHPDTLTARFELADAYWAAGRTSEAIELGEQVLADRERLLGAEHPDTLTTRGNLALAYASAGRIDDATAIEERLLDDFERLLGPQHPYTLTSRGNLASSYRAVGRTREAIELGERALADREELFGREHPLVLANLVDLASSYHMAGRTDEAIEIEERAHADHERVLGADHPHTLRVRANLSSSYRSVGRTIEAIELGQRALADYERILGVGHPDTLGVGHNLARCYQSAGRTSEAIELEERVLADHEQILGATHPETLAARRELAGYYRSAGRAGDADELEGSSASRREP